MLTYTHEVTVRHRDCPGENEKALGDTYLKFKAGVNFINIFLNTILRKGSWFQSVIDRKYYYIHF